MKKMDRVNNSHLYNFNGMSLNILHIPFCNYYATVYIVRGEKSIDIQQKNVCFWYNTTEMQSKIKLTVWAENIDDEHVNWLIDSFINMLN